MANRLASKVAIITGGAGGIGSQMASLFASEGAAVVIADIASPKPVKRITTEIKEASCGAAFIHTDVSSSTDVARLIDQTASLFGGLDILVNNAININGDTSITEVSEAIFDRTIAVC